VYGGGGNSGATYTNDFIEVFNPTPTATSVAGYSVQYASSTGSTWQVTNLPNVTLQPGQYLLVQESQGAGGTTPLPTPDASGNIAMSATAGKIALVSATTALSGTCPTTNVVDLVGDGTDGDAREHDGGAAHECVHGQRQQLDGLLGGHAESAKHELDISCVQPDGTKSDFGCRTGDACDCEPGRCVAADGKGDAGDESGKHGRDGVGRPECDWRIFDAAAVR
jgi:hypothetical protein